MPAGMSGEGFDLKQWLVDHNYSSVPVVLSLFTTMVGDAAHDRAFIVVGVTIEDGLTREQITQVSAWDHEYAAVLAAELCNMVGPRAMIDAFEKVAEQKMAQALKMEDDAINQSMRENLPKVPPSQEVVDQMIKDDLDRDKDGY